MTDGVEPHYIKEEILAHFFKHFWNHRMALDRRNFRQVREWRERSKKREGKEGGREEGRKGRREEGREGGKEGREEGRMEGRKGGKEGRKEGRKGREGGRDVWIGSQKRLVGRWGALYTEHN